ncbi:extensin [Rhagoletis pomonella]|uniref:extensin n=1 Tax=Rhagoletis pomonella TaxID=28610 RepID=UPI0017848A8F|nr:extensin [Rhagoletis pomonella]
MRAFVLVSCLLASALARPEAGYTYNGLLQNHASQPLIHQQLPSDQSFANFAAPPPTTYGTPPSSEPSLNSLEQPALPAGNADASQHQIQPLPLDQQDSYNAAYLDSSIPQNGGYPYAPQPTTVHKHVYVHVPPKDFEEEDVIQTRVHHAPAAKQKHYKIVFIKAPAPPAIRPPVVPPPPQNEEKTLIYVLHKKPEANTDIVIPTAAPTKPSKPEVYFIKYKTKKDEAPVYGPPPQQQQQQQGENGNGNNNFIATDMDPRNADVPASEYSAPAADEFAADLTAPLTTIQPALQPEQPQSLEQQPKFANDLPTDAFELPTTLPFAAGEQPQPQPTAQAPSNQYLAPESMAPIVVEEPTHLPSAQYGPPSHRFFLKKK